MTQQLLKNLSRCGLGIVLMLGVAPLAIADTSPHNNPSLPLRGLGSPLPAPDKNTLGNIKQTSEETSGAIFEQPEQVLVKPPILKALIELDTKLSPYDLDANGKTAKPISLRDVEKTALDNNLTIKISNSDEESQHWQYRGALGGFLPSITNAVTYQYLTGKFASPFGLMASITNTYLVMPSTASYYFFQGGKVVFGASETKHKYQAAQFALKGTTNDILYDASKLYYNLALNDVLLQIRVKAVETSQALLARDQIRFENGASTKLDVLQARTQLSKDRQALISQQIARRQAAIHLATALNLDTAVDLTIYDRLLSKTRLVSSQMSIGDLLNIAIDNRPELKQYEQLRLAAKDAIKVARSALLPTVQGTIASIPTAAKVAPTSSTTNSQSAVSTSGLIPGGFGAGVVVPEGSNSTQKKFSQTELLVMGIDVEWSLPGLGTIDAAKVQSAKWVARKAQLEFNRELANVYQEVRDAYLDSLEAENLIKETTDAVESAQEQLQVSTTRLEEGVGTDLDVINAQRDYTSALIDKVNALVKFNIAQVQVLRTIGKISLATVTSAVPLNN